MYPDAAGGGSHEAKKGVGAVLDVWPPKYMHVMYPDNICHDRKNSLGVRMVQKLSFLEAVAALVGILIDPNEVRNRLVRIFSDNRGNILFVYLSMIIYRAACEQLLLPALFMFNRQPVIGYMPYKIFTNKKSGVDVDKWDYFNFKIMQWSKMVLNCLFVLDILPSS